MTVRPRAGTPCLRPHGRCLKCAAVTDWQTAYCGPCGRHWRWGTHGKQPQTPKAKSAGQSTQGSK
eukprot:4430256-Prorocentrum_lima.AAC.1